MSAPNIDDWCAHLFGYNSKEQFFIKYKEKSIERNGQFLNKNSEGSQGPCEKCGSENTSLLELQTRSADEPKSFFIVCGNCGAKRNAR